VGGLEHARGSEEALRARVLDLGAVLLRRRLAAAAFALLAVPAGRSAVEQAKIDRLLEDIRSSKATFLRNDGAYDGTQAASHLKRKLFFAGSRVATARDFVLGVASRSEESGRPYQIRFPGEAPRPLREWLLERLAALEKPPPSPAPTPTRAP